MGFSDNQPYNMKAQYLSVLMQKTDCWQLEAFSRNLKFSKNRSNFWVNMQNFGFNNSPVKQVPVTLSTKELHNAVTTGANNILINLMANKLQNEVLFGEFLSNIFSIFWKDNNTLLNKIHFHTQEFFMRSACGLTWY
jgi:hypothetical protein